MEACNPEFAELRTSGRKHPSVTHFAWGASSVAKTVRKKTGRRYSVRFPIDLLVYTDGNTAELDDLVKGQIEVGLSRGRGQFVQVWLWAGELQEAWGTPNHHTTLNDLHHDVWVEYEGRLREARRRQQRRTDAEWRALLGGGVESGGKASPKSSSGCSIVLGLALLVPLLTAVLLGS
jgi:hypothetical protein